MNNQFKIINSLLQRKQTKLQMEHKIEGYVAENKSITLFFAKQIIPKKYKKR